MALASENVKDNFAALGDRTRRAITRLVRGEATVRELAEPFDLTHRAISRYVGIPQREWESRLSRLEEHLASLRKNWSR